MRFCIIISKKAMANLNLPGIRGSILDAGSFQPQVCLPSKPQCSFYIRLSLVLYFTVPLLRVLFAHTRRRPADGSTNSLPGRMPRGIGWFRRDPGISAGSPEAKPASRPMGGIFIQRPRGLRVTDTRLF